MSARVRECKSPARGGAHTQRCGRGGGRAAGTCPPTALPLLPRAWLEGGRGCGRPGSFRLPGGSVQRVSLPPTPVPFIRLLNPSASEIAPSASKLGSKSAARLPLAALPERPHARPGVSLWTPALPSLRPGASGENFKPGARAPPPGTACALPPDPRGSELLARPPREPRGNPRDTPLAASPGPAVSSHRAEAAGPAARLGASAALAGGGTLGAGGEPWHRWASGA